MKPETIALRRGKALGCPRCSLHLVVALTDGVGVDACPKCKGIWVDLIEEKAILKIKPEAFTVDELHRLRKFYEPLGKIESVKYLKCPVCSELMYRKNWGSHSGVIVDRCADHGTWYDPGEVEKIREFITLGGIELEKLRIAEKGLADLGAKLNREVTRLDLKVDAAYRRARLWGMLGF